MTRFSDKEVITRLKNGSDEVLFYLAKRFFSSTRRWLRSKGIPDAETPFLFSDALVRMKREVRQKDLPDRLDAYSLLSNIVRNLARDRKAGTTEVAPDEPLELVCGCYSILDEGSRKLLAARFADKMNFEEVAAAFDYPNPSVAEVEINRAMNRLEKLVETRMSF